jgi:xylulokinase
VFFGATLSHNRADMLRAVLEGTAMAIRQAVEILESNGGMGLDTLRLGGTAARSQVWAQIIADVLGKEIVCMTSAHTEVLGAALLAGLGSGLYPSQDAALEAVPVGDCVLTPNPQAHEAYDQVYSIYSDMYRPVKPFFERIAKLRLPQVWVSPAEDVNAQ